MLKRLFLSVFILQAHIAGLVLIMLPWGAAWESNFFLSAVGRLQPLFLSPFVRGAVSGLGLINVYLGVSEAWHFHDRIKEMDREEP